MPTAFGFGVAGYLIGVLQFAPHEAFDFVDQFTDVIPGLNNPHFAMEETLINRSQAARAGSTSPDAVLYQRDRVGLPRLSKRFAATSKRWRDGDHIERWAASGLLVAERQFRKVIGFRRIPSLLSSMANLVSKKPMLNVTSEPSESHCECCRSAHTE